MTNEQTAELTECVCLMETELETIGTDAHRPAKFVAEKLLTVGRLAFAATLTVLAEEWDSQVGGPTKEQKAFLLNFSAFFQAVSGFVARYQEVKDQTNSVILLDSYRPKPESTT